MPKKNKYNKSFSSKKIMSKQTKIHKINRFSNLSLVASEAGYLTNYQLEAIRRFIRRLIKKKAKLFFCIFPNKPITKKPNEVRLGRGKANASYWTYHLKKGTTILEIKGTYEKQIKQILKSVCSKISVNAFVKNRKERWIY